jgi:hypothetical protein
VTQQLKIIIVANDKLQMTTVVIQTKPFLIHVTFIVGFLGPSLKMFCFIFLIIILAPTLTSLV